MDTASGRIDGSEMPELARMIVCPIKRTRKPITTAPGFGGGAGGVGPWPCASAPWP